jgi:mannose-6-phosphate isomerase-like protein (cupin superfamily)
MVESPSRRSFIRMAPLSAAFPLTAKLGWAAIAAQTPAPEKFQLFTADKLAEAGKTLQITPGSENLVQSAALPLSLVLTTEVNKSAKEFEYHEGRDHIVQIVEGSTVYEVGGTPRSPRKTKPAEWLAPASEGSTTLTLHKGDMLVIPRGTPHRRSTGDSVTFLLISTTGSLAP